MLHSSGCIFCQTYFNFCKDITFYNQLDNFAKQNNWTALTSFLAKISYFEFMGLRTVRKGSHVNVMLIKRQYVKKPSLIFQHKCFSSCQGKPKLNYQRMVSQVVVSTPVSRYQLSIPTVPPPNLIINNIAFPK